MQYDFIEKLDINFIKRYDMQSAEKISKIDLSKYFTHDIKEIEKRLDFIDDIFSDSRLVNVLEDVYCDIGYIKDLKKSEPLSVTVCDDLYSAKDLSIFIELVEKVYEKLTKNYKSEFINKIKVNIKSLYESDEFSLLKSNYSKLEKNIVDIKSITLGINIDSNMQVVESGVVSINNTHFLSGDIIDKLLRWNFKESEFHCISPLTSVNKDLNISEKTLINDSINNILNKIYRKQLKAWSPSIKRYLNTNIDYLLNIQSELRFLLMIARFSLDMKDRNFPICRPKVYPLKDKTLSLSDFYNPRLVTYNYNTDIKFNTIEFDKNGMIYIVTGANQGGKSVFSKGVGLCQSLFQLGCYVPAKSANLSPVDEIFTHFPSTLDDTTGRFDEECKRVKDVFDSLTEYSMFIFDESFSSTNPTEAVEISSEVIKALSFYGTRGLFITHFHDVFNKVNEYNKNLLCRSKIDCMTTYLDESTPNLRTYVMERKTTNGNSYSESIINKYGLTFDQLIKRTATRL